MTKKRFLENGNTEKQWEEKRKLIKDSKNYLKQFSEKYIDVLSQRMGGKYATIYCATEYKITKNGSLVFECEWMPCVANKDQYKNFYSDTEVNGYCYGRPIAEIVCEIVKKGKLIPYSK